MCLETTKLERGKAPFGLRICGWNLKDSMTLLISGGRRLG